MPAGQEVRQPNWIVLLPISFVLAGSMLMYPVLPATWLFGFRNASSVYLKSAPVTGIFLPPQFQLASGRILIVRCDLSAVTDDARSSLYSPWSVMTYAPRMTGASS